MKFETHICLSNVKKQLMTSVSVQLSIMGDQQKQVRLNVLHARVFYYSFSDVTAAVLDLCLAS